MNKPEFLLWLDLETTGLDPENCSIIEAHWFASPLGGGPRSAGVTRLAQPLHGSWEPYAKNMHESSGLLALAEASAMTSPEIEASILAWLEPDATYYLAGASIHFDRSFVRAHWPSLDKRLHYRMLDVTTLRLFWRALGVESPDSKDKPHRAQADIERSYAYYQEYLERATPGRLSAPAFPSSR